jgi:hypothetical protein
LIREARGQGWEMHRHTMDIQQPVRNPGRAIVLMRSSLHYIISLLMLVSCAQVHRPNAAVPRELAGQYSMHLSQSLSDIRSEGREVWESEIDDSYGEQIQTRFFSRASYELDGSRLESISLSGEKLDSTDLDSLLRICERIYGDSSRYSHYRDHTAQVWKLGDQTFAYVYYYPTMHEHPQHTFTVLYYLGPRSEWEGLEKSRPS